MRLKTGTKYKYVTYNALYLKLKRLKVSQPGTLAMFLLDTFASLTYSPKNLYASEVVKQGLCEEGKFLEWRKHLSEKKIIDWKQLNGERSKAHYFPGSEIVYLINREKLATQELATKLDLLGKAGIEELEQLRAEKNALEAELKTALDLKASVEELEMLKAENEKLKSELKFVNGELKVVQHELYELKLEQRSMRGNVDGLDARVKCIEGFIDNYLKTNPPDTDERRELLWKSLAEGKLYLDEDVTRLQQRPARGKRTLKLAHAKDEPRN